MTAPDYQEELQRDPASDAFINYSRLLESQDDLAQSLAICEEGLKHRPDAMAAHALRGKILLRLGRVSEAMTAFDSALAIDKTHSFPPLLVAEVLLERGLFRSAIPLLKKSIALRQNNPLASSWLEKSQAALSSHTKPPPWVSGSPSLFENVPDQFSKALSPAITAVLPEEPITRPVPNLVLPMGAKKPPKDPDISIDIDENFDEPPSLPALLLVPPPPPSPVPEPSPPPPPPPKGGLLDEIPEYDSPFPSLASQASSPALSDADRREMALEYENNVRERMESRKSRRRLVFGMGLLGSVVVVSTLAFFFTRAANRGRGFQETLLSARKNIGLDTPQGYAAALDDLSRAASMDDQSEEVWALNAYVHALLYGEYGGQSAHQREAASALAHPGVRAHAPGWALAAEYYLSGMHPSGPLKQQILTPASDLSELWELGARLYLKDGESKGALQDWKKALDLSSGNVRALSGLGEYYRQAGDCTAAIKLFDKAGSLSPSQAEKTLGAAECKADLGLDIPDTLGSVRALNEVAQSLAPRKILIEAKLLTLQGKLAEAKALLEAGIESNPDSAYEFYLAVGAAERRDGHPADAVVAVEKALAIDPKGVDASEALARLYLLKGAYRELVARFAAPTTPDSRGLWLARGISFAKMKDWKSARAALNKTQIDGKYPTEAVVYLALADAAEGHLKDAQETLEQLLESAKKSKNEIKIALGQLYASGGFSDKAKALLEQVAQDSLDDEAAYSLGRLELKNGNTAAAEKWFQQAVKHNPLRAEAWQALGHLQLENGRREEALKSFQWGGSAEDVALALYHLGRFEEANTQLSQALAVNESPAELQRLKALILFSLGKSKAAFAALEVSNKLNPKSAETFCAIGQAFVRTGNQRGALQAFAAAVRENPREGCGQIGSKLGFQQLRLLRGKWVRFWDKAFADSTLSTLALERNNLVDAEAYARASVEEAPFSGLSHAALAGVLARRTDIDEALNEFDTAVHLDPANGGIHLALADLLMRKDPPNRKRALEEYKAFLGIGGTPGDIKRVQKLVPLIKKRLAAP